MAWAKGAVAPGATSRGDKSFKVKRNIGSTIWHTKRKKCDRPYKDRGLGSIELAVRYALKRVFEM